MVTLIGLGFGSQQSERTLCHMNGTIAILSSFHHGFGPVACKAESRILGIGEGERYWKHSKNNSKGNRSNLSLSKVMKQAVISATYSYQVNEARRVKIQTAGVLWNDQDFEYCKLDHYCSGTIVDDLITKDVCVFNSYLEDWDDLQFNNKGDKVHAAKLSVKYGGIKFRTSGKVA